MDVRQILKEKGCVYEGHFVGVSGSHITGYINIDPLMPHVSLVREITKMLVEPFKNDGIETVVTPAVGAIPLSHWGAFHLEGSSEILGVWADKVIGETGNVKDFAFERSSFANAVKGRRTLILEDIINRMASISKIIALVNKTGGEIAGIASVAAYKGVSAEALKAPKFNTLYQVSFDNFLPEDCAKDGPCSKGEPIVTDIGHGWEFKKEHPGYKGGFVKLLSS